MASNGLCTIAGAAGKKNRQKERRLIKGFNLSAPGLGTSLAATASVTPTSTHSANGGQYSVLGETVAEISAEAEDRTANKRTPLTKLVRLAKLASANRDSQVRRRSTLMPLGLNKASNSE